ncbi:MAG: class I SAM-dependent methyltransferase [Candidatus Acidiferrales bacterium]
MQLDALKIKNSVPKDLRHDFCISRLDYLQYRFLKWISPQEPRYMSGEVYKDKTKIRALLGDKLFDQLRGKVVIDFGCGEGNDAIALAKNGSLRVIGIDIRESVLERARKNACSQGIQAICHFCSDVDEQVDAIVSVDSFEHFSDPASILLRMHELLKPDGAVFASFGPTWYHPLGGHLFSVFPWSHLIFSERALIRWRSDLRSDGANHFAEVEGGLNQMTISRFERLVEQSPFLFESLEAVPIRRFRLLHSRMSQEFTTSIVRCKLIKRR